MRTTVFAGVFAIGLACCGAALALNSPTPVVWTLSNAAFQAGTHVTGSFTYDAANNLYRNINISTSAGSGFPGTHYTAACPQDAGGCPFPDNNAEVFFLSSTGNQTGLTLLGLFFTGGINVNPSSNAGVGGATPFNIIGIPNSEGICANAGCSTTAAVRYLSTATLSPAAPPAAAPTLTEWAMIGLGAMLAGVGALMVRRRAQAF